MAKDHTKGRPIEEREFGGFPGEKHTYDRVPRMSNAGASARVWAIECDKPKRGIARIADRDGLFKGWGAQIHLQVAGQTKEQVDAALRWFLTTFPSADITPTGMEDEPPYTLNPITLGEALGKPSNG